MKNITLLLFALIIISCAKPENPNYSIIHGKIENLDAENITVKGFDYSKEINLRDDNTFSDTLYIDTDGFYELYVDRMGIKIYLEKGKNLDVNLDGEQPEELFTFDNDLKEHNRFLFEKDQWSRENMDMRALFSLDEAEFKNAVKEQQQEMKELFDSYDFKDANFKNKVAKEDQYFEIMMLENYQGAHRFLSQNKDFEVSDGFYDAAKNFSFNDEEAYKKSMNYRNLVQVHYGRIAEEEAENNDSDYYLTFMKLVDSDFSNGPAKEELFYDHLQFGLSPTEHMIEIFDIYKNSDPDQEHLAELNERYEMYLELMPGKPSPVFKDYENYKGGTVSLDDLKGKYAYIDVWATWCGPCLQEIPYLKEVEKDYAGKNIQIVSMSIDVENAYDKWREMIEKDDLGGLQILADKNWESSFVQEYGIMGIPRFILLDPEGNIVSADAPRPSDPKLRNMLDQLL